ncbi:MAG: mannose-1-phosphate guanylyltransferase/mannose-6-phosphate isomerase [Nitrospirae bacterium]|nr:mannose-1-phosphate guanylyltransferase/mannose-6-phosphate isomerase [Nitrospirota bacterium]
MENVYVVIMAGGSGTRFWPLSREAMPKQLLRIEGEETLIQQTMARVTPLIPLNRIFIVTNKNHAEQIRYQLPEIKRENFIIEPLPRNTAAAIGFASAHIYHHNPDAVMAVLSADHVIKERDRFLDVLRDAIKVAGKDFLVTIGLKPTRPETGYGYIEAGELIEVRSQKSEVRSQQQEARRKKQEVRNEKMETGSDKSDITVYSVKRFVEKPDAERAAVYLKEGNFYWNSGMFVWKAGRILEEIGDYMPVLSKGLREIASAIGKEDETEVTENAFTKFELISIDYGVMEKSARVAVVPADFGWSDVGSWTALDEISAIDPGGNVIMGNVIDIDSRSSIIYATDRLVATIGLKDMVVVDTDDATLVCRKDRAQDVKKIVEDLKRRGSEEYITHTTVIRPWGTFTLLEKGERYKIKRIMVNPGERLSYQMHYHRSEHWVVVSGTAKVTRGEEVFFINSNESTYIPMETRHRLENPGKIPLQIIEVQNGEYLGEDDIVRFEDEYGRE